MAGKVALCVGATSGIGEGIAYKLAKLGANVILLARNQEAGKKITSDLKNINPNGKYKVISCEATSMKSIKQACLEVHDMTDKLNYCVLTQGRGSMDGRTETSEGIDIKMSLNYYGRVMVIKEMSELLQKTAATNEDVRVLTVLSPGIHSPYTNLDDIGLKQHFSLANCANATCFYNDLACDQFARNFSGSSYSSNMSFIHSAPGAVQSNFSKDLRFPLKQLATLAQPFMTTAEKCAEVQVGNALLGAHMGAVKGGTAAGFHLMTRKGEEAARTNAHNDLYREAVWKHTMEVLDAAVRTTK
jgi:hypothetical protein